MNLDLWKLSLGMMNVPKSDHLAKQIFRSMDTDRDGFVLFKPDSGIFRRLLGVHRLAHDGVDPGEGYVLVQTT